MEHLYFNRVFSTTDEDDDAIDETTVKPFQGNKVLAAIQTYGDLLAAEHSITQPKLKAAVRRKIETIGYIRPSVAEHEILGFDTSHMQFKYATQKYLYSQLIQEKSMDHAYQTKWQLENGDFDAQDWDGIWDGLHQQFFTEDVKSTIWEQIHLNFYTTYNYNKWHNTLHPCPLCRKIPDTVYHIILDCNFTILMWKRVEPTLLKIYPNPPCRQEKAFGLQTRNKREADSMVLRNWITFSLRHFIMKEERKAYYHPKYADPQTRSFIHRFNNKMKHEMFIKSLQYKFKGLQQKFDRISTFNQVIGMKIDDDYRWFDIM